jgi:hypothetical protein
MVLAKMTDTTTTATNSVTEPTKPSAGATEIPQLNTLASFISKAVDSYKGMFASFCIISSGKAEDGDKSHQATMYISDITELISADYKRVCAEAENDDELCFKIASQLITDSRVGKFMGLSEKLWEDIAGLGQLSDAAEYNGFVALLRNRDQQKKEMSGWCC